MSHVFISYSHKDSDYAKKLAKYLEEHYFEVWIDERINYGSEWPRVLQEKIDSCSALVLIMTPRSFDSLWVQNELARAQAKKKPIFPLMLEGDETWLSVQSIEFVDVRNQQLPPFAFIQQLARIRLQHLEEQGVKLPQSIPIPRIQEGRQLVDLFADAHGYAHQCDELQTDGELELVQGLLGYLDNLDIFIESGAGAQVQAAFWLSRQLGEIENQGLHVYAYRITQTIEVEKAKLENAELVIVIVSRADVDHILWWHIPGE